MIFGRKCRMEPHDLSMNDPPPSLDSLPFLGKNQGTVISTCLRLQGEFAAMKSCKRQNRIYGKLSFLVMIFLLLFSQAGWAQSIGIDEVIQYLREIREKTRDFSGDLLQEKRIALLKQKVISRGTIRYKYPDKVSIEFIQPEPTRIVFDGKTLLVYLSEERVAERYHVQSNPTVEKYLLFSADPFQEKLATWKIVEERESLLAIEILPKEMDFPFTKTKFWISKKDWIVTAMEFFERNGDTTLLQYSNIKTNTGLTDSEFEVQLPKDVKVTDIQ
jgi:outer membrane lipoprotein carrier protein